MQRNKSKTVSRRTFVAAAGVAVAAPYIIPASALGKEGVAAPSERIVLGVIGTGGQARGLTGNAIQQPDVQVVALCDVNAKTVAEAKGQVDEFYGNQDCWTCRDFRELNAREDIDAVIIGTPDHWHALTSIDAARHGKDIYCEKPLTWSLGEGQAVVKAVRENKRILQVGSMQRSDTRFKRACEIVRNGYLGKVTHINVSLPDFGNHVWVDEFPKAPDFLDWEFYVGPATWTPFHPKRYDWDWRWWMAFGGGQMTDWIGHHADIAHMAMDWDNTGPRVITGVRWDMLNERNNLYDAPARYHFECEYKGGVTMTVANASDMPEEFKRAAGDRLGTQFIAKNGAWLYVDRGEFRTSRDELQKLTFRDNDFRFRPERNHVRDFLNCVKSREEPSAPVHAGHRSASVGHLGKIACELGATLRWDPKTETFPKEPSLNALLTREYRGEWSLA